MTVLTGGQPLYEPDELLTTQRQLGYTDGEAGKMPSPPLHYVAAERAAYFQGHIRACLARRMSKALDARRSA